MNSKFLFSTLTVLILSSFWSSPSFAVKKAIVLQNQTGGDVDDLHIRFQKPTTAASVTLDGGITFHAGALPNPLHADFASGSFGFLGFVAPNNRLQLIYDSPCHRCGIVQRDSYWTAGGEKLKDGEVTTVGVPLIVKMNSPLSIRLENPGDQKITYTNIQLFTGNDLTKYNSNDFMTPTGSLFSGLPTSLTLNPRESYVKVFQDFVPDPETYFLATASVFAEDNPSSTFDVVTAYNYEETRCVPEPSVVLSLLAFGMVVATGRLKHRLSDDLNLSGIKKS